MNFVGCKFLAFKTQPELKKSKGTNTSTVIIDHSLGGIFNRCFVRNNSSMHLLTLVMVGVIEVKSLVVLKTMF